MPKILNEEQIKEVINLLDSKQWVEAENLLLSYKNLADSRVDYLLGCLYKEWDNPNRNEDEAKKYFGRVIDSDNPIEMAFEFLSDLEKNKTHSIRIIQKGLNIFPQSKLLYFKLLIKSSPEDRKTIYTELKKKNVSSERIRIFMAETYFNLGEFENTLE